MADIQKPVEVTADAVEQPAAPVVEIAPTAEPVAPVAEDKPVEETAAEDTKAEEAKEEVKPIEAGHLGYKTQGLSFPK